MTQGSDDSEEAVEEDYFLKEGSTIRLWRRRWMTFRGTSVNRQFASFDYWKEKEEAEANQAPRGQGIVQSVSMSTKRASALHIVSQEDEFHLQCRDEEQRRRLMLLLKPRAAHEVFNPDATTGETISLSHPPAAMPV